MYNLILLFPILLVISCHPSSESEKRDLQITKSKDIIILHTNDVHCGVNDTIGYDGLMLYKKQLMEKYENVILVDAGDHIQGGTIGLVTSGEAIIEIMNKLEYEVATIGNHEFDYGTYQLEAVEKLLNCSYISCNYCFRKNKSSIYPPTKIINIDNKKIGFIGVATPQTLSKTYLINIVDDDGLPIYDFLTENHSQELYDKVQGYIDELKKDGVNYIIILGHLGIGGDALEENTSAGLLKNLKNVDALIDGHSHLVYSKTTPDIEGNEVILTQTGTKLANIGILAIHVNGTLSHKNISEVPYEPSLADITLNITRGNKVRYADKEMNKLINELFESFSDQLNRVYGKTDFLLNVFGGASESTQSHTQISRISENALCNLVVDAMREIGGTDISIMNAGTVRTDINQGNITYQDIINTMPFSNDIISKEIKGQTVLEALEFGVRTLPGFTSRFPQVSGITYKIDTSINSTVVVDKDEIFQELGKENRVYDVKINGEDLDLNKTYTITSHTFILGGGDGYSMFSNFEITDTSLGVDNEVLLLYLIDILKGEIPIKYKASEGRLIKTNGKIYGDIDISLLDFENYTITPELITFDAIFVSLETLQFEFPKQFILNGTLSKNVNLRSLQKDEKNISCFIQNEVNETCAKYKCEIHGDTSGINSVEINEPEFNNFNVKLSPIALEQMNNLTKDINNQTLYNFANKKIFILQSPNYTRNRKNLLINIISSDVSLSDNGTEKILLVKELPDNTTVKLNCHTSQKEPNHYALLCELNSNMDYDLDNSVLIDDDKAFIINFQNRTESKDPSIEDTGIKRYFKPSSNGLSKGLIAAIVIIPVVLLAITAGLIIFFRKPKNIPRIPIPTASTSGNIRGNQDLLKS